MSKLKIKDIENKGNQRYFIEGDGKVYQYEKKEEEWKLAPVSFGFRNQIKCIALSYTFVLFLNNHGLVYSSGNNTKGQLGLGFASNKIVQQPKLI